jgi:hypothetical protein
MKAAEQATEPPAVGAAVSPDLRRFRALAPPAGLLACLLPCLLACGNQEKEDDHLDLEAPSPLAEDLPATPELAAAAEPPIVGGSRLQAVLWKARNGVSWSRREFFDTATGNRCTAAYARDGRLRCMPHLSPRIRRLGFRDSKCEDPVLVASDLACQPIPRWAQVVTETTCPVSFTVYETSYALGLLTVFHKNADGSCNPVPEPVNDASVYAVGEEIPPETFAPMDETVAETEGRLALLAHGGPDGSRSAAWWFDRELGRECLTDRAEDGEQRCLPRPWATVSLAYSSAEDCFGDSVGAVHGLCAAQDLSGLLVVEPTFFDCPLRKRIFTAAEVLPQVFTWNGSFECVTTLGPPTFLKLGDEVPPEQFPPVEIGLLSGSGRLRGIGEKSGPAVNPTGRLWDSRFRVECAPARAADGRMRCLPLPSPARFLYGDPACTERLVEFEIGSCLAPYVIEERRTRCPITSGVFHVGAAKRRSQVYQRGLFGCQMALTFEEAEYHAIGAEIPATQFAALEESFE